MLEQPRCVFIAQKKTPLALSSLFFLTSLLSGPGHSANQTPYRRVLIQKGSFHFPRPKKEVTKWSGPTIRCDSDIQSIEFLGSTPAIARINRTLASQVPEKCNPKLGMSKSTFEVPYISKAFVGVTGHILVMPQGAGGSCHGAYHAQLFDRTTGKELLLKDVVARDVLPSLYPQMAEQAMQQRIRAGQSSLSRPQRIVEQLRESGGNLGLLISNKRLFVLFNSFISSCADGNRNVVAIPPALIQNKTLMTELGLSSPRSSGKPTATESRTTTASQPIQLQRTYNGSFLNKTYNLRGDVVIRIDDFRDRQVSGYINFSNKPGTQALCGAGDFRGEVRGRRLLLRFNSSDPDEGCNNLDKGFVFDVDATISPDGSRLESGTYHVNDSQAGVFQATAVQIGNESGLTRKMNTTSELRSQQPAESADNKCLLRHNWKEISPTDFASAYAAPFPFSKTGEPEATLSTSFSRFDPSSPAPSLVSIVQSEADDLRRRLRVVDYLEADGPTGKPEIHVFYREIKGQRVGFIKYRTTGPLGVNSSPVTVIHGIAPIKKGIIYAHLLVRYGGHTDDVRDDQLTILGCLLSAENEF